MVSSPLSVTLFIRRRIERDLITNVYWFICKVPVTLVRFLWNLDFISRFSKNTQIPNFIKMSAVKPSCSMRTDRQT